MKREFTNEELKGMWSFLVETFELTEEQLASVDHQVPMTQELFDSIIQRCEELGPDADPLFFRMLDEYPDFVTVHAERILEAIKDVELPKLTPEESERNKEALFAKIRVKYGADAI